MTTIWSLPAFTRVERAFLEQAGVDPDRVLELEAACLAVLPEPVVADLLGRIGRAGGFVRQVGIEEDRVRVLWGPYDLVNEPIANVAKPPQGPPGFA